ncbi:SpaA isopeptide-forming pilin-related protein [uncultured Dubosiella sp.]|uniref:SpaA isopeptide-forming pilin-related protein n=1 Tax=uncultured Dubosiella sp. TaxID=1937011 RepID=UPI002731A7A3|nr:SpaA isopeptide-forming pilin-related protein [uncultured Dubosiella sp.]
MKSLKKLLSIFAAFMMVVGLTAVNVSAEGTATITVEEPIADKTYTAYQLFSSTTTSASGFVADDTQKNALEGTGTPFTFEKNVSGSWNVGIKEGKSDADVIKFIKQNEETLKASLKNYAHELVLVDGEAVATVPLGYYFVTTGTGTVITLETVNENKVIKDKNDIGFEKTSNNSEVVTDKQVGDTVPFTITFKAYKGWTNVKVSDELTQGLEYVKGTDEKVALTITATNNQATTHTLNMGDNSESFDLTFPEITTDTTFTISYNAKVTKDAIFVETSTNTAKLDADNNPNIGQDTVTVYNYDLTIDKFAGNVNDANDIDGQKLSGAEFQIFDKVATDHTRQALWFVEHTNPDNENEKYYTLANSTDANATQTLTTPENGQIVIRGLAKKTYYIKETKAPNGYNLLKEEIEFTPVTSENNLGSQTNTTEHVPNYAGAQLPSTGGMGTTMLYVAGAILMVGAAVIFVTNKRMKHE